MNLCPACEAELPKLINTCQRCAEPLPEALAGQLCGHCQKAEPAFSQVCAGYVYAEPMRSLIHMLKYQHQLSAARCLGLLLSNTIREQLGASTNPSRHRIVPVPLHSQRQRERSFNQALEISRSVAKRLQLPLVPSLVRRTRATADQIHLNAAQRRRNLHRAFQITAPCAEQHIILVDDVMTTGSTVNELAAILRQAGAASVSVAVCARAKLGETL